MLIPQLVLASHNTGKLNELAPLLSPYVGQLHLAGAMGLPEPAETARSFAENAHLKAKAAQEATGLPALADDSGLCVEALHGAPGVFSAWWAGPQKDFGHAMWQIEQLLQGQPNRRARFVATLVLLWPNGEQLVASGECAGSLVWPPRGTGGHGYDPIFVPDGHTQTFAEMEMAAKNQLSHRGRAVAVLLEALAKRAAGV